MKTKLKTGSIGNLKYRMKLAKEGLQWLQQFSFSDKFKHSVINPAHDYLCVMQLFISTYIWLFIGIAIFIEIIFAFNPHCIQKKWKTANTQLNDCNLQQLFEIREVLAITKAANRTGAFWRLPHHRQVFGSSLNHIVSNYLPLRRKPL